jgi:hypothetical protein
MKNMKETMCIYEIYTLTSHIIKTKMSSNNSGKFWR